MSAPVADAGPLTRVDGYAPIADYAAIGDGRTLALVARDGSLDWLPLPTIDRGGALGSILDVEQGGCFMLAPEGEHRSTRRYVGDTNVLETTFTCEHGTLVVTDALTAQGGGAALPWVELVRRVRCASGVVRVRWSVRPRFGYGRAETEVTEISGAPVALGDGLRLAVFSWGAGAPLRSSASVAGSAELREGDEGLIACVAVESGPIPFPSRGEVERRLQAACDRGNGDGADGAGRWRDAVARSALALELLTFAPTGALVAAGTTGLPERVGGPRNYDYRFGWIRDTAFALDALSRLGRREQVHATLAWVLGATAKTHPRLQPLYALDGSVPRRTRELPLDGYRGSRPVRRGNGAASQLQLGSYGDLLDAVWHYVSHGNALDPDTGQRLAENASFLCEIWRNEDGGLWELGQRRHYTISKMSCWLALTRAAALAEQGQVPREHAARWRTTAEEIHDFVEERCWSESKRSYSFYAGTDRLDCAVLLASRFGFVDPRGERMSSTIDALRAELGATGPLLYRYSGMQGEEGCFLACSFWLVGALAEAGRVDEAQEQMAELVELGNDVGLYAEEMDPATHEMLGNFPQALTHLSLIRAAFALADAAPETGEGA